MTAMIGCRTPATFIRISGSENGWMFKNLLSQAIWIPTAVEGGVKMCLSSPDGDQGYPGEMQVSVTYTLQEKTLAVEYEARCSKTTPVNLTNHSYFNLGGQAADNVYDHEVSISAHSYLPVDDTSIPTGFIS
ncbi:aldose 1-epimerase isoform X2 [Syngnathoides biaculeatus]|uniref:aldose 1-epimerase isoform X2 n=1 Tax=Syngnathoides biaculeatus TaxID=300417 RepID=UPI002ADE0BE9|nr:aldose 1-epimerase isoform X2 [Syngnathoides biaculeatus]